MTENENTENWRTDVGGLKPKLKILDGETKEIEFLDEGTKSMHPDYGESVKFMVKEGGEEKVWYVNSRTFTILTRIKEIGTPLKGHKIKISRTGEKKSDTRYAMETLTDGNKQPEVTKTEVK